MEAGRSRRAARCVVSSFPGPNAGSSRRSSTSAPGVIESWTEIDDVRPTLLMHEAAQAIGTIRANPEYLAALARRGITADMIDRVQIDPWPAGVFGYDCEDGRRISRCISFLRDDQTDNGYARPIEGLIVHFDNGRNEVLEVNDHGVTPMPPNRASYLAADQPRLRTDLKPISITQPEGPSFTVDGNLVQWQKWQFRVAFDPFEGLVLHQVGYNDDDGRLRSILHRASISEMVVPYGDPGPAARLEERVRRGGVGPRPDDAVAHARLRLRRRDPLLRRDARDRARQAVGDRERDLHARRGLRNPLEARRPLGRHQRGAAESSPRGQLHFNCRQLRIRLLLVLLPRWQHPARGQAHRHRVADGDRIRRRHRRSRT